MEPLELTLVIPAYNEEHRIRRSLEAYHAYLAARIQHWELLVVTNGCKDRTIEVVQNCAREMPAVRHKDLGHERGKGLAIRRGFEAGSGKVIGFCDADAATPPEDIFRLFRHVAETGEVAIASRWLPESNVTVPQTIMRRLASRVFNLETRLLFGFNLSDTQCGAKFIPRDAAPIVTARVHSSGFVFDVELLWRLHQAGYKIAEIPITWHDEGGSTVHVAWDGPKMALDLARLRLGRLR